MTQSIIIVGGRLYGGGSERVATSLANGWADQGRNVIFVLLHPSGKDDTGYLCHPAVQRVYVNSSRLFTRLQVWHREQSLGKHANGIVLAPYQLLRRLPGKQIAHIYFRLLILWQSHILRQVLRSIDAPVVISFGTSFNVLTILAASKLGKRVIISERNDIEKRDYRFPWSNIRREAYHQADLVTANSHDILRQLAPYVDATKLAYVPNPLLTRVPSMQLTPCLRHDAPTILTVARLSPQKNHALLLAAFAQLPARLHDWRLAILGDGACRTQLQRMALELGIAERVDWYGYVANPYPFYESADIFVLPSLYEGQSNALLEAMSAAMPVVVTDLPAHAGVVEHDTSGLVIPVDDVQALVVALTRLAEDSDVRRRLGQAAAHYAARHHIAHVLPQWDHLIERVLSEEQTVEQRRFFNA